MKKSIFVIATLYLLLVTNNCRANETYASNAKPTTNIRYLNAKNDQEILARINEIKAMDKSELSSVERRELRKELRETKKYLELRGGGVYLSVGAIIIIVLLLILIL